MAWHQIGMLRPRQHDRHFADNISKCIFLNENLRNWNKISLKFVSSVPINNVSALVQIVAWRRTDDKPLSDPLLTQLSGTYVCHPATTNRDLIQYWPSSVMPYGVTMPLFTYWYLGGVSVQSCRLANVGSAVVMGITMHGKIFLYWDGAMFPKMFLKETAAESPGMGLITYA